MKRKFFKKMALAAGIITATLLLGACGGSGDNNNNNNNNGSATDTSTPGSSDELRNTEDVTEIRVTWRRAGEHDPVGNFLENHFVEQFEADNPDIKISLQPIQASESDFFARLALQMQSSSTAPDVVAQDSFQLNADASAGFLLQLDDRVAAWDEWQYYTDNLKSGFIAQDGGLYAIPGTSDSRGLWFNRDVFDQAGLPQDWQPQNWEDILTAAEAIRDNVPGVTPLSMNVARSAGEAVTMQTFLMFLHGTEDVLFDHEAEKWVASSPGFLDSLKMIDEIFNQRDLAPPLSIAMGNNYGSITFQQKLPEGEAGIALDGFWNIGNWIETGPAPLDDPEATLGFVAMPTQHGQAPGGVTLAGGWGWSIPANSQNHEKSWRVLQALGSAENQATRAYLDGNLTVREDSAQDPRLTETPFIAVATSFLENAHFRPAREEYPQVSVEIQIAVESVASGSSTPEQAMAEFQRAITNMVGEDNVINR